MSAGIGTRTVVQVATDAGIEAHALTQVAMDAGIPAPKRHPSRPGRQGRVR